jgi:hypothetical protein
MIYRGWIIGLDLFGRFVRRETYEKRGIIVTSDDGRGCFTCEMSAETLRAIGPKWGAWLWGLEPVGEEAEAS